MCGIVGIISKNPVVTEIYDSLIQLQHRGQNAAGIATIDDKVRIKLGRGLVSGVFRQSDIQALTGNMGLGHVRYPTAGSAGSSDETQPFWIGIPYGMAIVHNGNLVNYQELKEKLLLKYRRHLNTNSDSEVILNLLSIYIDEAEAKGTYSCFFDSLTYAIDKLFKVVKGSYSIICSIAGRGLVAFRDPYGIKPLIMGKNKDDNFIFASETTPFGSLGYTKIKDINPGELIYVNRRAEVKQKRLINNNIHPCIFEYIYFSRPDADLENISVYNFRNNLGKILADKWVSKFPDITPDIVVPVPFSSNIAAIGFANHLKIPYKEGIYKNPFIGRTFIMHDQKLRKRSVQYKLNPQHAELEGKEVLLLDDSIVRGTTSKEIISMVKKAGARKIYFVSTAPPIISQCFYGMDIPTKEELIANKMNLLAMKEYLNVDVLLYQDIADLKKCMDVSSKNKIKNSCMACMDNNYICGKIEKKRSRVTSE